MANFNITQRVKSNTKQTARHVSHAAANPWLEQLERFGYIIRGLVYATIGVLALQLAMGAAGGSTTTQSGAIAMLGSQPFGKVLLILIVVGLAGYSLWGFIRAIFDPLHRGSDSKGILARIGFAFSGLTYGILLIPPLQSLMNQGSKPASNPADISVMLFNLPFGKWLVVGLGLVWIAIGLGQLYVAYKQDFKKDFQFNKMSASEVKWATRLGQIGYAARGIVFAVIGTIIFQAGLTHNPSQPQGFDTALLKLAQAPNGTLLLGGVALGLIAFGIFSALSARWIKVS